MFEPTRRSYDYEIPIDELIQTLSLEGSEINSIEFSSELVKIQTVSSGGRTNKTPDEIVQELQPEMIEKELKEKQEVEDLWESAPL